MRPAFEKKIGCAQLNCVRVSELPYDKKEIAHRKVQDRNNRRRRGLKRRWQGQKPQDLLYTWNRVWGKP